MISHPHHPFHSSFALTPFPTPLTNYLHHAIHSSKIGNSRIKLRNKLRKIRFQIITLPPQIQQMLQRRLHLILPGTPQIHPLTHQQPILRLGKLPIRPRLDHLPRRFQLLLNLHVSFQIPPDLGMSLPIGILLVEKGTLRVESRGVPPREPIFPLEVRIGEVAEEFGGGLATELVGRSVGVLEFVVLEHVGEEVGGGEGEFGGDGGGGVVGAAEEEGHGGVEVFEFFVVLLVPSHEAPTGRALGTAEETEDGEMAREAGFPRHV
mmetsp:Transcript_8677/g.18231  ORF Transcript_8677/g.18231 Transcript_8677/m.18231 type:complete len:264 (-) Transcript_8677:92-883(-)